MKTLKITSVVLLPLLGILSGWLYYDPPDAFVKINLAIYKLTGVQTKTTPHFEIFYKENCSGANCNSAQCMMFIHGLGDQALTWTPQLVRLSSSWPQPNKLFAVNLPTSGNSPHPKSEDDYQISQISKKLTNEILNQCPKWTLVGNSFGGAIAMHLASENSDRVQLLVLESPAGAAFDRSFVNNFYLDMSDEKIREADRRIFHTAHWIPERVSRALRLRFEKMNLQKFLKSQEYLPLIDEKTIAIAAPTHVAWGLSDRMIPPTTAETFKRIYPHWNFTFAEKCGHKMHVECPSIFNNLLDKLHLKQ